MNIEGLKNKSCDKDFLDFSSKFSILLFVETWSLSDIPIEGFTPVAGAYRKREKGMKGRNSGGTVIYRANEFNCIKPVPFSPKCRDCVICLITTDSLTFAIIALYRPPCGSAYEYANCLQDLGCDIDRLASELGIDQWILMADANSRTGSSPLIYDEGLSVNEFSSENEFRQNRDTIVNTQGRQLLSFIQEYSLCLLNGAAAYDDSLGEYTFVGVNGGKSSIDVCLCTRQMVPYIQSFKVSDKVLSHHFPLELGLTLSSEIISAEPELDCALEPLPRWNLDINKVTNFAKTAVSSFIRGFQIVFFAFSLLGLVAPMVTLFSSVTTSVCQVFVKKPKNRLSFPGRPSWFNHRCEKARKAMYRAVRKFRKFRCETSLHEFIQCRSDYRKIRNDVRDEANERTIADVNQAISENNSHDFWKVIKRYTKPKSLQSKIAPREWMTGFAPVMNAPGPDRPEWSARPDFSHNEILDSPISANECAAAIRRVKAKKAPGRDGLGGDFFKAFGNSLVEPLAVMFSTILRTGIYPVEWSRLVLFPIFKNKGSPKVVRNYRAIALLPVVTKMFSSILNRRLSNWADVNNAIDDRQAGFRRGYSTMDNIFVLDTLISKYKKKRQPLMLGFVDFREAFNRVPRSALIFKLGELGVSSKFLAVLESMYSNSSFCVKVGMNEATESQPYTSGVFTGDTLSPTLFCLFINSVFSFLDKTDSWSPSLGERTVNSLLYADDLILISKTTLGLQRLLNALESFADYWGTEVNVDKSFILVCKSGWKLKANEKWFYKGQRMSTVRSFKYLGATFSYDASFKPHIRAAAEKGKKAARALSPFFHKFSSLPLDFFLRIFDSAVVPVELYGAEIWGGRLNADCLDTAANFYYRMLLGLPQSAPVAGLHLELGRSRISELASIRPVSYWLRLLTMHPDRLTVCALLEQRTMATNGTECWGLNLKSILEKLDLSDMWLSPPSPNLHGQFLSAVKRRMADQSFVANLDRARHLPSLISYCEEKVSAGPEEYLKLPLCKRRVIALFRMNCKYSLPIIKTSEGKMCDLCTEVFVDDPWHHFLFICPKLKSEKLYATNDVSRDTLYAVITADTPRYIARLTETLYAAQEIKK